MNLYNRVLASTISSDIVMSTRPSLDVPTTSVTSISSETNPLRLFILNFFYYNTIILPIIIFIIGLIFVLKKIGNEHDINKGLKIVSFILPIIGIILYFVNAKKDKKIALIYLKASVTGIITYILMYFGAIIMGWARTSLIDYFFSLNNHNIY